MKTMKTMKRNVRSVYYSHKANEILQCRMFIVRLTLQINIAYYHVLHIYTYFIVLK